MFANNPKKEFTVAFPIDKVKETIHKVIQSDPSYYALHKDDPILNQIVIHQKGVMLDTGFLIDFDLKKISDTETNVLIEVSRNAGAINTAQEVSRANNSLKIIVDTFSAMLAGKIDPQTGKADIPANKGCMLFILAGVGISIILLLAS